MPLPLPDLDTRRFDDLIGEMRALIPQLAPAWTNHNTSDPGITLIELMAWVVEVNLYRANRIPARTTLNFISLLLGESSVQSDAFRQAMSGVTTADIESEAALIGGEVEAVFVRYAALENRVSVTLVVRAGASQPAELIAAAQQRLGNLWLSGPRLVVESLDTARQRALLFFNDPYRAITRTDFEREALLASPLVRRVAVTTFPEAGTVTVAVVPASGGVPDAALLAAVRQRLDDRRLVGTRIVVRPPRYTALSLALDLVVQRNTVEQAVLASARATVLRFFDPLAGGPDQDGWPFGRRVSVFELYRLLESVPGVDHVAQVRINGNAEIQDLAVGDLPALSGLDITAVA